MIVLGIETSCDETAAAVLNDGNIISDIVLSQVIHSEFGGVVPELASREHQKALPVILNEALNKANININDIDGIAVTYGPGLIGALLTGLGFAKGLSYSLKKPFIGVNHLEGHLWAYTLENEIIDEEFISLIISGGHSIIVKVNSFGKYKILGQTLDDACGEAFDKVAKLLGLGYPGGKKIDDLAKNGDPFFHKFPTLRSPASDPNLSFSGLKTAVLYYLNDLDEDYKNAHISDICASFQNTIAKILISKVFKALEVEKADHLVLAGGVAANSYLKKEFSKTAED
ncbi:tRNA (adenosine(37)-N6)-threonylcarbamoyltransferase complex transferase subunit TsaD, partial [candidate division KSB1 bacterium]